MRIEIKDKKNFMNVFNNLYPNNKINDIKPRVSPDARKIVAEKKIDIHSIKGSGKNGIVLK